MSLGLTPRLGLQRSGGARAWTPADLGNALVAAISASNLSLLYQDSAGTTPVSAANDPVGLWRATGSAAHSFSSSSTSRPLYKTSGNLRLVESDGVNDIMTSAARVIPLAPPFSICFTANFTVGSDVSPIIAQYTAGQAGRLSFNTNQNSTGYLNPSVEGVTQGAGPGGSALNLLHAFPGPFLVEYLAGTGAEGAQVYLDGLLIDTFTVNSVRDTVMELFGNAATIGYAGGKKIYGLIITNTKLSGADRTNAQTWLRRLAGIPTIVQQTLSVQSSQTIPDGLGSDAGKGFACTGLDYDEDDNALWVGNDGRNNLSNPTYTPSLVQLSLDGTTKLAEIALAPIYPSIQSVQGVAYDESDNTLWFASLGENLIRHVTKAGAHIGSFSLSGANGVAYDRLRDRLWVSTGAGLLRRMTKAGATELTIDFGTAPTPVSTIDQIFYDEANDFIWITTDESGPIGKLRNYDCSNGVVGAHEYTLTGANAIEGVYVNASTILIMNDSYMHSQPPYLNQMLTYAR